MDRKVQIGPFSQLASKATTPLKTLFTQGKPRIPSANKNTLVQTVRYSATPITSKLIFLTAQWFPQERDTIRLIPLTTLWEFKAIFPMILQDLISLEPQFNAPSNPAEFQDSTPLVRLETALEAVSEVDLGEASEVALAQWYDAKWRFNIWLLFWWADCV